MAAEYQSVYTEAWAFSRTEPVASKINERLLYFAQPPLEALAI
jgi:hypothetical protein